MKVLFLPGVLQGQSRLVLVSAWDTVQRTAVMRVSLLKIPSLPVCSCYCREVKHPVLMLQGKERWHWGTHRRKLRDLNPSIWTSVLLSEHLV